MSRRNDTHMTPARSVLVTALITGAIIGAGITMATDRQGQATAVEVHTPAVLPVAGGTGTVPLPDFAALVEAVSPSIVNISTVSEEREELPGRRGGRGSDPFEFFFRRPGPRRSLGSGFVLDDDGYIITNHHVVEDATKIVVRLQSDKEYEAKVVGTDAKTDIAVIRIEDVDDPAELVALPLGDSDDLKVGEWVLAIGNPFGLDHSVTAGIVSAKGRRINRPDRSPYDDFIQTDAAINPGNSGGPLVNLAGQVVGINSAIFSRSGGNIGIGFAIPINMVRAIVPQLKEFGSVTRGWLGVMIQPVDKDIARSLDLDDAKGALVAKVFPDSPASEAGIELGDVIVKFDGREVPESADLPAIVAATPVGKSVNVVVVRNGKKKKLEVTVAKLEGSGAGAEPVEADELGLSIQDITPEIAKELGLDTDTEGVVVSSVTRGSPAEEAGIRAGDVIQMVGNRSVTSAEEFREELAGRSEDASLLVLVRRGDQTLFRVIKPAEE
ncbi:MAG: DegQ family serine endoprotease [Candidatus Binatia bacterium]